MTTLTPEQIAYKQKTLNQLLEDLDHYEGQLEEERRPKVAQSLEKQLEDIQQHVVVLQQELTSGELGEPIADNLYRRAANAILNERFYLARRLISKLETIEPFYPDLDRLKSDVTAGKASRRTQAVARGGALPEATTMPFEGEAPETVLIDPRFEDDYPPERRGIARLFEFHIVASCVVVLLVGCAMFGVAGTTVLQWLVEGN